MELGTIEQYLEEGSDKPIVYNFFVSPKYTSELIKLEYSNFVFSPVIGEEKLEKVNYKTTSYTIRLFNKDNKKVKDFLLFQITELCADIT